MTCPIGPRSYDAPPFQHPTHLHTSSFDRSLFDPKELDARISPHAMFQTGHVHIAP